MEKHVVSIFAKWGGTAEILVDGQKVENCVDYKISQVAGGCPQVYLMLRYFCDMLAFEGESELTAEQEPQKER